MDLIIKKEKNIEVISKLTKVIQELYNKYYPDIFRPFDYELIFNHLKNGLSKEGQNFYKNLLESSILTLFLSFQVFFSSKNFHSYRTRRP